MCRRDPERYIFGWLNFVGTLALAWAQSLLAFDGDPQGRFDIAFEQLYYHLCVAMRIASTYYTILVQIVVTSDVLDSAKDGYRTGLENVDC